jgi:hypothetical protein
MLLHICGYEGLTVFQRPFVHAAFGIMDVTVKKLALI